MMILKNNLNRIRLFKLITTKEKKLILKNNLNRLRLDVKNKFLKIKNIF
jgi:hypothetical protein